MRGTGREGVCCFQNVIGGKGVEERMRDKAVEDGMVMKERGIGRAAL